MAKYSIVYSTGDPAGAGASKHLIEVLKAKPRKCPGPLECYFADEVVIAGFNVDVVNMEFLDETPDPEAEAIIVLSKHRAESGRKTLSVHHTGNPTGRAWGGEPYKLSTSYPALSKALLTSYAKTAREQGLEEYHVTLEATHHGPTRPFKPIVFIEIGSTEKEWTDERARIAMALAVAEAISKKTPECNPTTGIGGTHYPEKFTKIHLEEMETCLGHIISRHQIDEGVPDHVIRQAIEKTHPQKAQKIIIEKKSLKSEQRKKLEETAKQVKTEIEYR